MEPVYGKIIFYFIVKCYSDINGIPVVYILLSVNVRRRARNQILNQNIKHGIFAQIVLPLFCLFCFYLTFFRFIFIPVNGECTLYFVQHPPKLKTIVVPHFVLFHYFSNAISVNDPISFDQLRLHRKHELFYFLFILFL